MKRTSESTAPGARQWFIRAGNYITLAELFDFGRHQLSCFDLYRTYRTLPRLIYKRFHSISKSEYAQRKQNARTLHYQEEGHWRLPKR